MCVDVSEAVRHLLNMVGYEGKLADTAAELPCVLMETDPEDVQWLKVWADYTVYATVQCML